MVGKGLIIDPRNRELLVAKTRLFQLIGKTDEAEYELEKLLEEYPNNIEISIELGRCRHRKNDYKSALLLYDNILKQEPENIIAIANTITILEETRKYNEVEAFKSKINKEILNKTEIKSALTYYEMKRGNYNLALTGFSELTKEQPENPLHWLNGCACLRALKRNMSALKTAQKGLLLNPDHRKLKYAYLQCLAESGGLQQARRIIESDFNENEFIDDQYMMNMQFIGEGYKLIDSARLKIFADAWERERRNILF